jgi:hypothetical protein
MVGAVRAELDGTPAASERSGLAPVGLAATEMGGQFGEY